MSKGKSTISTAASKARSGSGGQVGRPPGPEPLKQQIIKFPESFIPILQDLADEAQNASEGKGNKTEYVRSLVFADAKNKGKL